MFLTGNFLVVGEVTMLAKSLLVWQLFLTNTGQIRCCSIHPCRKPKKHNLFIQMYSSKGSRNQIQIFMRLCSAHPPGVSDRVLCPSDAVVGLKLHNPAIFLIHVCICIYMYIQYSLRPFISPCSFLDNF